MLPRVSSRPRSLWDRWRSLRIVASTTSELVDKGPIPHACYRRWDEAQTPADRIARAARWNGTLVGGAILEIRDDTATVRALYVAPTWRGHGIGKHLLRTLLRRARLRLVRDVRVLATAADAGFYTLHGFRPVDEHAETRTEPASAGVQAEAFLPMRRRLTLGLVNTPVDGITVKM